jgi:hypothetical protein
MDWIDDLRNFEYNEEDVEYLTEAWNRGENHPLYGTKQDKTRREKHSQDVKDWWAQYTPEERKKIAGSYNKGRFWITNGTESKMTSGEIPDGWKRGRGDTLSPEGRERVRKATAAHNKTRKRSNCSL